MAVARNKIKVNGWNVGGNYSSYTQQGRFFRGLFAGDVVGMEVKQATSLGMDIEIHQGSAILTKNTHSAVIAEIQDTISMTVPTADQSNPRIDTVVVYEDGAVVIPENVDEYWQDGDGGRFKVAIITGTASATPSGATDSEISRALNTTTYAKLAEVRVEARTTTITQGNITDIRQALTPRYVSTNNVDWTTQYVFEDNSSAANSLDYKTITIPNLVSGGRYMVVHTSAVAGNNGGVGTISARMIVNDIEIASASSVVTQSGYQNPRFNLTGVFTASGTTAQFKASFSANGVGANVSGRGQRTAVIRIG